MVLETRPVESHSVFQAIRKWAFCKDGYDEELFKSKCNLAGIYDYQSFRSGAEKVQGLLTYALDIDKDGPEFDLLYNLIFKRCLDSTISGDVVLVPERRSISLLLLRHRVEEDSSPLQLELLPNSKINKDR